MDKENILYYQSNIKTSRDEDSVYAMRFASQQMLIDKLQQENKILKENAEHNDKVVDKVNWENQLLKKENEQLKDNWNMLKEYCKENTLCYEVGDDENTKLIGSRIHGLNVLDKMQEMEKNYGNVEDNT